MAFIRELIVSNATIPSESESTNLSFKLQAEAEVAHIIVNKNTYIGVIGRDRITWEFEPISIFRSEFPGDGEHELIVTANVYSNKMRDPPDPSDGVGVDLVSLADAQDAHAKALDVADREKVRDRDTQQVSIIVNILPIITEPTDYPEYRPKYFVDIKANLNKSLIYNGTSISFKGKVVSNTDNYQVGYKLPSGSKTIDCGNINANDINNFTLGSFNPTLTITANTDGTQNGVVNITGSNILQTITEDPRKAQILYWGDTAPTITSTSADILSSLLTKSKVEQLFANEINTLEEMYTYNVVSSWIFDILPVDPVKPPEYNQFDRYAYVNNRTFPNIFYNDEYIVLETGHNYEIKIIDVNGVEQTIIPSTEIFARITHSGEALLLI